MNEDPMPGTSAADQELARRWRRQSLEEPSSSTDARIRAAARDAIASSAPSGTRKQRNRSRWTRFMPLAAAASVALLAVGLVRLIPREQYEAVPTPELARPGETPEPDPAAQSKQDSARRTPSVRRAISSTPYPPLRSLATRPRARRRARARWKPRRTVIRRPDRLPRPSPPRRCAALRPPRPPQTTRHRSSRPRRPASRRAKRRRRPRRLHRQGSPPPRRHPHRAAWIPHSGPR